MADIHPTAIIDEQVVLADDVYVGPGCVVRGDVTIGAGCILHGHAYLHGPLTMGRHNRVYPFACLGFSPQHADYDPAKPGAGLVIGDHNVFREAFIAHRAFGEQPTRIGDRNFCMANSHVGHDGVVGNGVTLAHGALIGGHGQVHDGAIVGGNAALHQFGRIGRLAMIAGVIGVNQDVPPFCVMYQNLRIGSLNLIGLRRAGLRQHIKPLRRAFDLLYHGGHGNQAAADLIDKELGDDTLCVEFAQFIRGTKRGITGFAIAH